MIVLRSLILFIIFSVSISCAMASQEQKHMQEYIGTAQNYKMGAAILQSDRLIFIKNLPAWPETAVGKTIHVKGNLTKRARGPIAFKSENGVWSQGYMPSNENSDDNLDWVIENAEWKIKR